MSNPDIEHLRATARYITTNGMRFRREETTEGVASGLLKEAVFLERMDETERERNLHLGDQLVDIIAHLRLKTGGLDPVKLGAEARRLIEELE